MAAMFNEPTWLAARPIAHRGLHDAAAGVHENSLSAFEAAIERGYAIECDIRLSADGAVFVFHDDALERMTGATGRLREQTAEELRALTLRDGQDGIPSFTELLTLVAGKVPLVVELKGTDAEADRGFVQRLEPLLADYEGPLALMSFAPWLVSDLAVLGNRHPIGLTAEGTRPEDLERHRSVFEAGCNFVSYNVQHLPNAFVDWVRETRGLPVISWTVRTPADEERSLRHADQMTFEGFLPQIAADDRRQHADGRQSDDR